MAVQRAGLSRDRVLRAAVALVDREGLDRLTMRRLGADLGVEAMTLYHYVANREALLDGIVEVVVGDAVPAIDTTTDWRPVLRAYGTELREALRKRPGVLPLVMSRPAVTPSMLDVVESVLDLLQRSGFSLEQAWSLVRGTTVLATGSAVDPGSLGEDDPITQSHPQAAAAFAAAADRPDAMFELALDGLLDGYAGLLST
ncbi:TetR/AcrR family transcriptional regulator [Aeromicrobium terrae]|uniref:TetR/AcrR family transcriptional regulator n=1 Tax=Aeromicrobium terrae TaxID=2498846 RepID=UPI00164EF5A7|nr:TetR/AcrR family transcriptional regulator C-terminal domain-containing protein [Aeromicrobium terrae]